MNMMETLVFWFDGPPVCSKGVFDAVAEKWNGKVIFVVTRDIDNNRSKIVSDQKSECNNLEYIFFHNEPRNFINRFVDEHLTDIHIFNGYTGASSKYLFMILRKNKVAKTVVWLERIGYRGDNKRSIKNRVISKLQDAKHYYYAIKLRNKITALMPIGQRSISTYRKLGWKDTTMLPFFYMPVMNEKLNNSPDLKDKIVKFVYLGRFSSGWKGTDLLIGACKKLNNTNYTLEMVGGYGDYKEQTLDYIGSNEHLHFGGTWKINDACENLNKYDVCIVPSRYEGWNPTINEALMAGIGCITTTESVSDELVTAFDCGIVTDPDADSIAKAMDSVMDDVQIINKWKKNAFENRKFMNADACANYFINVLDYLFFEKKETPILPWNKGNDK